MSNTTPRKRSFQEMPIPCTSIVCCTCAPVHLSDVLPLALMVCSASSESYSAVLASSFFLSLLPPPLLLSLDQTIVILISFASPSIHLLASSPPSTTPTQVVLFVLYGHSHLHSPISFNPMLQTQGIGKAILACIRPRVRLDVRDSPDWRRALRKEPPAAPTEDSVNQFGHIRRAQNR